MPPSLCFITRPSCKHALRKGQMQYFLLVQDRDAGMQGEGEAALLCKRSLRRMLPSPSVRGP